MNADTFDAKERRLLEALAAHPALAVAFSGGVDSSYLLAAAVAVELALILASAATVFGVCGAWPLAALLAFIPLIEVVLVVVPLTPGGLGLREALLAVLFAHLGLSEEQTGVYVALGLASLPLRAAAGLPFVWRRGRDRGRAAPAHEDA